MDLWMDFDAFDLVKNWYWVINSFKEGCRNSKKEKKTV